MSDMEQDAFRDLMLTLMRSWRLHIYVILIDHVLIGIKEHIEIFILLNHFAYYFAIAANIVLLQLRCIYNKVLKTLKSKVVLIY